MPKVQTYRQQQPTAPRPNVRRGGVAIPQVEAPVIRNVPSGGGAAQFGETLARVGQDIATDQMRQREEEWQNEKQRQDDIRILHADRQLAEWENTVLDDPRNGVLLRKGENAFGLIGQVSEEFEKRVDTVYEGLSNQEQKDAFMRLAHTRRQNVVDRVTRHESAEFQKFGQAETEAYILNAQQAAVANFDDPTRVGTELERIRMRLRIHGEDYGLPAEESQRRMDAAVSATHVGVIDRMLANGQDINARTYFRIRKAEILGQDLARVESSLQEGSLRGQSQRFADTILAQFESHADALDAARKIEEPELRDLVTQRVDAEWRLRKQLEREERERTLLQAKDALDRTMTDMLNLIDRRRPVFARDVVPPSVWNQLTSSERNALESYNRQYQEKGRIDTDMPRWLMLMDEANVDPSGFAERDLGLEIHRIEDTDLKELKRLQNNIREGKQKEADTQLDDFRTETQIINNTLGQMGIDAGLKENHATASRVHQMVGERAGALARATGKPPTNEDIQAIADDIVATSYTVDGWIWDTEKPLVQVTIRDIPREDRRQIEAALREANRVVTDEAVVDLYIQTKQQERK